MIQKNISKIIVITIIYLFSFINSPSQTIQWEKALGGVAEETLVGDKLVKQTPDGGYVIAGTTGTPNNGNVSGSHGSYDYWMVKVNSSGTFLWGKCYGGSSNEYCRGLSLTSDHGFILVGTTGSMNGNVSGFHGVNDIWVVKTDSVGTIQWQKCIGGSLSDYACGGICQATDGSYYILGVTVSSDGDVSGGPSLCWLIRLSTSGNIIWEKGYNAGSAGTIMLSIAPTTDGGCVLGGFTATNGGDVSGNHGGYDVWVVKIDSLHNLQWQKCFGGSYQESPRPGMSMTDGGVSVIQTNDGGYMIGSGSPSIDGDVIGGHGGNDMWMVKTDNNGTLQWQKCIGGSGHEGINSIFQTSDGGYVLTGSTSSSNGDISVIIHDPYDYFVLKTDNFGTPLWQADMGGSDIDLPTSIIQTTDGGYLVGGSTLSTDFDVTGLHSQGYPDYWLVKLSATVGMGNDISTELNNLSIYPNPCGENLSLTLSTREGMQEVKIYDVVGNEIRNYELGIRNEKEVAMDVSGLAKGMYFMEVQTEQGILRKKFVKL